MGRNKCMVGPGDKGKDKFKLIKSNNTDEILTS